MSSSDFPSALIPIASSTIPPKIMIAPPIEVADEEPGRIGAVADQPAVEGGAERAEDLRDGEEHGDRLGADLDRPGLADREVGGARTAEAKKKITIQQNVCVVASRWPSSNIKPLIASKTPEMM